MVVTQANHCEVWYAQYSIANFQCPKQPLLNQLYVENGRRIVTLRRTLPLSPTNVFIC